MSEVSSSIGDVAAARVFGRLSWIGMLHADLERAGQLRSALPGYSTEAVDDSYRLICDSRCRLGGLSPIRPRRGQAGREAQLLHVRACYVGVSPTLMRGLNSWGMRNQWAAGTWNNSRTVRHFFERLRPAA